MEPVVSVKPKPKMSIPWGKLGLELVVIVAGVLLGLMVNEWREGRNRQAIADNALASVASEMRDNHEQLVGMYQYYRAFIRNADSVTAARKVGLDILMAHEIPGWRGAMPPMLRSSSYDMLIHSGIIKDVPFSIANDLARIYNLQALLRTFDEVFISKFAADPRNYKVADVRHSFYLYYEIIPSLVGYYQHLGKAHLEKYGYGSSIEDEQLRQQINRQMGGAQ